MKDIIRLREASSRCRAIAASSDDGYAALSYAQLADEIDGIIVIKMAGARAELKRST